MSSSAVRQMGSIAAITPDGEGSNLSARGEKVDRSKSWNFTKTPNDFFDFWISNASPTQYVFLSWLVRQTIGWHRDETEEISLKTIAQQLRLTRHTVEDAARFFEKAGVVIRSGGRGKRPRFKLNVSTIERPRESKELVQNLDKLKGLRRADIRHKRVQKTAITCPKFGHGLVQNLDTPIKEERKLSKEIKKAAAASRPDNNEHSGHAPLSAEELSDAQRILKHVGIRLHHEDVLYLKATVTVAGRTFANFRVYVEGETFESARSPKAVLFKLAKEFSEGKRGVPWPDSLKAPLAAEPKELTREELMR